jgi:hypothetical protein
MKRACGKRQAMFTGLVVANPHPLLPITNLAMARLDLFRRTASICPPSRLMRDSSFCFSFEISGKTSLAAPLGFTRLGEVLVGLR